MKINSTLTITSCLFVLLQLGGQAQAKVLPQGCYDLKKSEYDAIAKLDNIYGRLDEYELESKRRSEDITEEERRDIRNYQVLIKGLNKKKVHIDLTYTQETPNSVINVDASKSHTPSGKIEYNWVSHSSTGFAHNDSSKATNTVAPFTPGSNKTLTFGITDPVCRVMDEAGIAIRNKN